MPIPEHHSVASRLPPQGVFECIQELPKERCEAHPCAAFHPQSNSAAPPTGSRCQRCSCRFTCPLEIITCFLCGVGDGTNVSYVRQVLYHLATLLAPKPILRVVSITIYFFP